MFTNDERRDMLMIYVENNKKPTAAIREYRRRFPGRRYPSRYTFQRLFKRVAATGSSATKKWTRPSFVLNEETEINILAFFTAYPSKSIRDFAREIPVSIGSIKKVLKKYKWHPYKPKRVQKLRDTDYNKRVEFCRTIMGRNELDDNFISRILWTDESSFSTSRGSHRGNTHFWSNQNPRQIEEIQYQGRQSLSVWCGVVGNHVLGPIIYDGALSGERYLHFLRNNIDDMLEDLPLDVYRNIIWQQDGAPPHNVNAVRHFLSARYNEWIGKFGTIYWPPNSPDLTLMDLFFWGHIKALVYTTPCYHVEDLRIRIERAVNEIRQSPNILQKLPGRIRKVYVKCIQNEGRHVEQYNM